MPFIKYRRLSIEFIIYFNPYIALTSATALIKIPVTVQSVFVSFPYKNRLNNLTHFLTLQYKDYKICFYNERS